MRSMSRDPRIAAVLCVAALLGGGAAYARLALPAPRTLPPSPTGPVPADSGCVAGDAALLSPHEIGAFTRFLDTRITVSPFRAFVRYRGTPPLLIRDYRVSRQDGFLANLTLHGRYRRLIDDYTRSLHYTVGYWPLVPFVGKVVRENPGPLEVYQWNWSFKSPAGAIGYMQMAHRAIEHPSGHVVGPDADVSVPLHPRLGDDAIGSYIYTPHDNGMSERAIGFDVRFGSAVINLNYQGGRGIAVTDAMALLHTALAHVARACATPSSMR